MSDVEDCINCQCYFSPRSPSSSRRNSLSVSRNNSRRNSLTNTPHQPRNNSRRNSLVFESPQKPLSRRNSLSIHKATASEFSPPLVTSPEVRRFRNSLTRNTPNSLVPSVKSPTPKLPHQETMTRSLFSFFQKTKVGRKLAYVAGSSNDGRRGSILSELSSIPKQSICHRMGFRYENARKCEKFLDQAFWTVISVVATITSLLAYDFTIAFLPKEVDMSTDIILLLVFLFFFVELIVASLVRRGYFLSFWFWLDFIAMISMIPDLTLLLNLFGAGTGDVNFANTQASKAGKSGRSAVALKAIRMIRFSRLLRVLRVFKFFQTDDDDEPSDAVDCGSTKVGQIVSEAVTKKVIVLVLILVLALPWMDPSGTSYAEGATTSAFLFKLLIDSGADAMDTLDTFDNVGVPILEIQIAGQRIESLDDIIAQRRNIEMWTLPLGGNDDFVTFDIRGNVLEEAYLGMCLTFFAIVIFAASTSFVAASTMSMVVEPIARLTELLKKMAGVIGILGGAATIENMMEKKDELFIVEALCTRIMDIFGTGSCNTENGGRSSQSKAISMMASRKVTHIASGDRVWEIDVKEKHRTSLIERRVTRSFDDFVKSLDNDNEDEASYSLESTKLVPELKTLRLIVDNPITLYCLRMFMSHNLTINNLLFILEAEEWAKESRRQFQSLYNKYCSEKSPAQINLNGDMFGRIGKVHEKADVLYEGVFDEAIGETWELMERNLFKQFLDSDYCKFYIHMKQHDPFTLNQLQLSVATESKDQKLNPRVIRNSEVSSLRHEH